MKPLVINWLYYRMTATNPGGGAERSALCHAEAIGAPLYTCRPKDDSIKIGDTDLIWSKTPARVDWPEGTSSVAMSKLRFEEIKVHVKNHGFDSVINHGCNASMIRMSTRIRKELGIPTVHVWHNSFGDFTFSMFGAVDALWDHRQAGGVNLGVSRNQVHLLKRMLDKKSHLMKPGIDANQMFQYFNPPVFLDYVPEVFAETRNEGVFVVSRFSPDKMPKLLTNMLLWLREEGVPVEAHFNPDEDYLEEFAKANDALAKAGAIVRTGVSQQETLRVASGYSVSIMASQIESSGIVPVEMAAMGIPTMWSEHHEIRHPCNDTLGDFGRRLPQKPTKSDVIEAYQSLNLMTERYRRANAEAVRTAYSKAMMKKTLEDAISSQQRLPTPLDIFE